LTRLQSRRAIGHCVRVPSPMCPRCRQALPEGEPCPACGEPVTALRVDAAADGSCEHHVLPVTFERLGDGRYRALAYDGAVIHTCLAEEQREKLAQFIAVDPAEWISRLSEQHADGVIRRDDVEGDEAWNRLSGEPHLFGVEVIKNDQPGGWQVTFWALEHVREEPLESLLRAGIERRLRAVRGVTGVRAEDREIYWVTGISSGEELAAAGAAAVDDFADELRSSYGALGG
jgi:hypothetical protein